MLKPVFNSYSNLITDIDFFCLCWVDFSYWFKGRVSKSCNNLFFSKINPTYMQIISEPSSEFTLFLIEFRKVLNISYAFLRKDSALLTETRVLDLTVQNELLKVLRGDSFYLASEATRSPDCCRFAKI